MNFSPPYIHVHFCLLSFSLITHVWWLYFTILIRQNYGRFVGESIPQVFTWKRLLGCPLMPDFLPNITLGPLGSPWESPEATKMGTGTKGTLGVPGEPWGIPVYPGVSWGYPGGTLGYPRVKDQICACDASIYPYEHEVQHLGSCTRAEHARNIQCEPTVSRSREAG